MSKFYITTAIPYVNASPHVGHALEFVQADVIKRYQRLLGNDAFLLSGSDENALKNVQAAENQHTDVQEFVDNNSLLFQNLARALNIEFDVFQKGSNPQHHTSSQDLWQRCANNGDIYKKTYVGLYCVGCEAFYEKEELNQSGECFEHPGKKLEEVSEENYFFRLSKYEPLIKSLLEEEKIKIIPESRKNEMLSFLKQGLKDISISRSNERAKNWGVSVPDDPSQKMYVWFDALNIYRSGVEGKRLWPAEVHVIGKGITKFHAIYWPAFLLSAGLDLPRSIFVHGYFTVNGQKMSKTLGNVVDPFDLINTYGADALRYYLLSQIPSTEDGDFSEEKLKTVYNADLANGLGNLVSRVAKLAENSGLDFETSNPDISQTLSEQQKKDLLNFNFHWVLQNIWTVDLHVVDQHINQHQPWLIKDKTELKSVLQEEISDILLIACKIQPFLPDTAQKIFDIFSGPSISSVTDPLFPRIL